MKCGTGLKRRRPQQTKTIALKQLVDKMRMPDSRRPRLLKRLDGFLNAEPESLDEIGADEKASSVEAIVAVASDQAIFIVVPCLSDGVDELDETGYFLEGGRNFRDRWICFKIR
jgi:hypothetical protein